jgi:hypothetical protein
MSLFCFCNKSTHHKVSDDILDQSIHNGLVYEGNDEEKDEGKENDELNNKMNDTENCNIFLFFSFCFKYQ